MTTRRFFFFFFALFVLLSVARGSPGRAESQALPLAAWQGERASPPAPAAIELLYFTAVPQVERVALEWATASEVDNTGYFIRRQVGAFTNFQDAPRIPVRDSNTNAEFTFIPIPITCDGFSECLYQFYDPNIEPGKTYQYILEDISAGNISTFHGPVQVTLPGATYTPSPTVTASPTGSAAPIGSATVSPSATPTPSQTPTASPTATPTQTRTPTPTSTGTLFTPTPTRTPTRTATAILSPTATRTLRPTRTPRPSVTPRPNQLQLNLTLTALASTRIPPGALPTSTLAAGFPTQPTFLPGTSFPGGYPPPLQPGEGATPFPTFDLSTTPDVLATLTAVSLGLTQVALAGTPGFTPTATPTQLPFPLRTQPNGTPVPPTDGSYTGLIIAGAVLFLGGSLLFGIATLLYMRRSLPPVTLSVKDFAPPPSPHSRIQAAIPDTQLPGTQIPPPETPDSQSQGPDNAPSAPSVPPDYAIFMRPAPEVPQHSGSQAAIPDTQLPDTQIPPPEIPGSESPETLAPTRPRRTRKKPVSPPDTEIPDSQFPNPEP